MLPVMYCAVNCTTSTKVFKLYFLHLPLQVRFDQMTYAQTKLRFLTEGLLLRQLQNDPCLHAYDIVILDEVQYTSQPQFQVQFNYGTFVRKMRFMRAHAKEVFLHFFHCKHFSTIYFDLF